MSLAATATRITRRHSAQLHTVAQIKARAERYARLHRNYTADGLMAMERGRED